MRSLRPHLILIPLLATLAVLPELMHGCSCGHDFPFHLQSWLEAARQFRHGTLYPHWAYSPAWQAGEPRFIFYPPLSWMLGGLLSLVFPANFVPVAFVWIALAGAGFAMRHAARHFGSDEAALVVAAVYMAGPYMMFNALERAAFAELLAAVWIPLVLLSVLRERPSVSGIALPLGLAWLTNAPSGVMASYTLVLLGLMRVGQAWWQRRQAASKRDASRLASVFAGGIVLGLALVSFYLLPAAYQRRFVQVDMVIMPNLRYQDNFLFARTSYEAHNIVTHRVSIIALSLLLATVVMLALGFAAHRVRQSTPQKAGERYLPYRILVSFAITTAVIAFLLFPFSAPVWEHLPNLKFLQFPWRLMTVLSAVLCLALMPLLSGLTKSKPWVWGFTIVVVLGLSHDFSNLFRQRCESNEWPAFALAAMNSGHGVLATDEYTPLHADNDIERPDNPGYWIVTGDDINTPAPGTFQNPNEVNENYDEPMPFQHTVAQHAPTHLVIRAPQPKTLVLNLRDYPIWRVTRNGKDFPLHVQREDGLLALPLPAGESVIDISMRNTKDQVLGDAISVCALGAFGFAAWRSRKIKSADES